MNHERYNCNGNCSECKSCCDYPTLANYNSTMGPPVPATTVSGYYVVPEYGAPGYDTLMHGQHDGPQSCGSYFNIEKAYGADAYRCKTKYRPSKCGGHHGDHRKPKPAPYGPTAPPTAYGAYMM